MYIFDEPLAFDARNMCALNSNRIVNRNLNKEIHVATATRYN